jgi:hypothetical protein
MAVLAIVAISHNRFATWLLMQMPWFGKRAQRVMHQNLHYLASALGKP